MFKAVVLRNGTHHQVDAAEVVPGDILVLSQGQKIPADARVIESHGLRADESALTGKSVGADKSPELAAIDAPLAERSSMVFGSTFITHGTGLAVAVRTGMQTEVGRIAASLEQMAERPTPFQVEVQKMARQMTAIVGTLAVTVAIILLFALHEPPVDVAVNTLSLAVATIPESLPIVLTFALALGAHHRRRAEPSCGACPWSSRWARWTPSAPTRPGRSRRMRWRCRAFLRADSSWLCRKAV